LVLYGIVVIQPTAPMPVFGVLNERAHGHVVTTILLAFIAMLFTAISYGRMARAYPSAGSAFTYVAQEIHPAAGYIAGWGMVLDYVINPMIMIIWCSKAAMTFLPAVPYLAWAVFFFLLFTGTNLVGIKNSSRVNGGLAVAMGVVIAIFLVVTIRFLLNLPHADAHFYLRPLYDPTTFDMRAILGGTSIAVLTYIGFDGISTLSEEAENPRRNVLLATVLTCCAIAAISAVEVYAGQLVWPGTQSFHDVDTAYVEVAARVGGAWLSAVIAITLLVASIGSGMGAQLGAARLLYGMGRSNALPKTFFGAISPVHRIPRNNVVLVGFVALTGALLVSYSLGAEMLNFGALVAFMGVNAAAFVRYYVRSSERQMINFWPPLIGFAVCFLLCLSLGRKAQIAGLVWMTAGIILGAYRTRCFRRQLLDFTVPGSTLP
jgi:putrescine importer